MKPEKNNNPIGDVFLATDAYRNEYLITEGLAKSQTKQNKNSTMKDLNKALRVEEYYSSVRSPLMLDEIDEYNAMGSNLRLYDKDNHN